MLRATRSSPFRLKCLTINTKRKSSGPAHDEHPSLVTPDLIKFPEFLKSIESKWKMKLMRRFDRERYVGDQEEKFGKCLPRYILSMFPYPSGRLHLGHVRIYTSGDILARYSRLMCKNEKHSADYKHVIYPMGFDSFGLPAENAAKERGLNPATWTNSNIRTMKQQLDDLSIQFDWREATSNPSFYRWTQEIFLKLMDAGLVYKSYAQVNWDPVDKTVLADEQVDEEGKSWRSGALIEKRNYRQWFIKVNAFTNEIYNARDVDQETWGDILSIQRNWIGQPSGWLFYLPICQGTHDMLPVFTMQPELFKQEHTELVIASDHWFEKIYNISKTGYIKNPFSNNNLKVVLTEDVEKLPKSSNATLRSMLEAGDNQIERKNVLEQALMENLGGYYTSERYRDWLISRQRFWGTPIPVISCRNCGNLGVHRDSLPVRLPAIEDFSSAKAIDTNEVDLPKPPLEKLAPLEWINTSCPKCGEKAKRECETFDTLFDSSWYFLRYAASPKGDKPFDSHQVQPVWSYIGGELNFREPFKKLLVQGVVKSKTYKLNGRYLSKAEVESLSDRSKLNVEYEKMSKSKGNGVDPQNLLDCYGIDATRLCLMSYANPKTERLWRTTQEEFKDVLTFMRRVTLTVQEYVDAGNNLLQKEKLIKTKIQELNKDELEQRKARLDEVRNTSTIDATYHIQESNQFRQYISSLHVLLGQIRSNSKTSAIYTEAYSEAIAALIVMMNPLTPHLSEELWLHFSRSVINPLARLTNSPYKTTLQASDQPWPASDDNFPLLVKVRGLNADTYAQKIPLSKEKFKTLTSSDIASLVESHFARLNDYCKVHEVKKYDNLMAIVTANIDSVNQKIADKKQIKKAKS